MANFPKLACLHQFVGPLGICAPICSVVDHESLAAIDRGVEQCSGAAVQSEVHVSEAHEGDGGHLLRTVLQRRQLSSASPSIYAGPPRLL